MEKITADFGESLAIGAQIDLSRFRSYGVHAGWPILSVSLNTGRIGDR